jgi:hypothetical protein
LCVKRRSSFLGAPTPNRFQKWSILLTSIHIRPPWIEPRLTSNSVPATLQLVLPTPDRRHQEPFFGARAHAVLGSVRSALILISLSFLFCAAASAVEPVATSDPLVSSTLIYVSDYFSFIGSDSQGRVAFALDTNRGRDGSKYQAEHFVVLHDERQGWVAVEGIGSYPNPKRELAGIPDSAFFHFEGSPKSGLTIVSAKNDLTLKISGIPLRTQSAHAGSVTWMGSAPAVLTWHGRTIAGRVIYEYLLMPNFNRLTRTYWGMWKDYQGLYLSAYPDHDIYLHSHHSDRLAQLISKLTGFAVFGEIPETLQDLRLDVIETDFAPGLYRYPKLWRVTWTGSAGQGTMMLTLSYRKNIANWLIGGFAMAIVTGDLSYNGKSFPIYGLAELIM